MVIDVRKKVTAMEVAKLETKEVQKQFLKLGQIMTGWVDKYQTAKSKGE